MAFVNLLQAVYPVGSVYFSTNSTSPADIIGGTWIRITGAVLGFTGANAFGSAATYSGDLAMTIAQMPSHYHTFKDKSYTMSWLGSKPIYNVYFKIDANAGTASANNLVVNQLQWHTTDTNGSSSNFIPRHFAVYGWYRTA